MYLDPVSGRFCKGRTLKHWTIDLKKGDRGATVECSSKCNADAKCKAYNIIGPYNYGNIIGSNGKDANGHAAGYDCYLQRRVSKINESPTNDGVVTKCGMKDVKTMNCMVIITLLILTGKKLSTNSSD